MSREIVGGPSPEEISKIGLRPKKTEELKQENLETFLSPLISEAKDFLSKSQEEKFSYYFEGKKPKMLIGDEVLLEFPDGVNLVFEPFQDKKGGVSDGLKVSLENYSFPKPSPWQKEKEIFKFSKENKNIAYERWLISKEGDEDLVFESKKADFKSLERLFKFWSQGSEVASKYLEK